jgi:RNA polymerase sigma factor (sigma-70 family)
VRGRRLATVSLGESPNGTVVEPVDDRAEDPQARVERVERADELGALVAALPERYRVAVVLRHVEDFRYAEIAELLGQPVGTVKANVHRGVRLLRATMEGREPVLSVAQGVR